MNISIITNKPIAYDSPDHIMPYGVKYNNSSNKNFNNKLYKLFDNQKLLITDWGCAGGAFIKDCIDDGHFAIGLEGSDYRKNNNLPEWNSIPNNLFTCDISSKFEIQNNNNLLKFDVITLWEVMEHILEKDLHQLLLNIKNHLKKNGLVIMSINVASEAHKAQMHSNDFGPGKHHQNIQSIEWWDNKFKEYGFELNEKLKQYFKPDWIRGPGLDCCSEATEERYFFPNLQVSQQWATINRVLQIIQ